MQTAYGKLTIRRTVTLDVTVCSKNFALEGDGHGEFFQHVCCIMSIARRHIENI